jgi:hypothetical protein
MDPLATDMRPLLDRPELTRDDFTAGNWELPSPKPALANFLQQAAISQAQAPDNEAIKFYSINNFITLPFTLTIFTKDLDLYFYWREYPELVIYDLTRAGLNRRAWFETILLPR